MALIIPIPSMLGSNGRVRLDRIAFQVLKKQPTVNNDDPSTYPGRRHDLLNGPRGRVIRFQKRHHGLLNRVRCKS